MTDKTWFGGDGSFTDSNDWSPSGVPVAGDTATLGTGTLEVRDQNLTDIPLTMGSYYGATLDLHNSVLGNVSLTTVPTPTGQLAGHHDIGVSGYAVLNGSYSTNASGTEYSDVTTINIDKNSAFVNLGRVELTPQMGVTLNVNGSQGSLLVNNGLIEVESGPVAQMDIGPDIIGVGTIELGVGAPQQFVTPTGTAEFGGYVGAGQTFEFSGASGAASSDLLLKIDVPNAFKATIANFTEMDSIDLKGARVTFESFRNGVLTLKDGCQPVAHLHFSGNFTTSDFTTQVVGHDTLIRHV